MTEIHWRIEIYFFASVNAQELGLTALRATRATLGQLAQLSPTHLGVSPLVC